MIENVGSQKAISIGLKYISKSFNNKKLHLIGLVSDGGVHSHISHLEAILDLTEEMNINNVFIKSFFRVFVNCQKLF